MQPCPSNAKPIIWIVDEAIPSTSIVNDAALLINNGGLVVYPTETFYALGGQPTHERVIKRIFAVKERNAGKPLPLIAASATDVRQAVNNWSEAAELLAQAFWPGPLTLIMEASPKLPSELHLKTGKIAIRISPHPLAEALAESVGGLLISTSANISGQSAIAHPDDIEPALLAQIDGLIHAGKVAGRTPSTIVDVSAAVPRLIRAGCVPWEAVEQTLQRGGR